MRVEIDYRESITELVYFWWLWGHRWPVRQLTTQTTQQKS